MPKYGDKLVIGLTGGIASGKTQVGKLLTSYGVLVIDADKLAREIVAPDTEGLAAIVSYFGPDYLNSDGSMDRVKTGLRVFSDSAARQELNRITHPLIRNLMRRRCREAQGDRDIPYIVYEAALLIEADLTGDVDEIIVVSANTDLQISRVMKRNNCSEAEARARVGSQYPLERKLGFADHVILNDNDRDALGIRTLAVHAKILGHFRLV
jgi:dephospho-CoA kinase